MTQTQVEGRQVQADTLPFQTDSFSLPLGWDDPILGLYETDGLVLFWAGERKEGKWTTFHVRRPGDPVPEEFEFVTSCQRQNGAVILLFRERH